VPGPKVGALNLRRSGKSFLSYSDLNARLGEIEDARRAGIRAAMSAEKPSVRIAVMMTTEL
jgi:hypothetical protein